MRVNPKEVTEAIKFIIDGAYNEELIKAINKEDLPVSHIVLHVPQNPIGNGNIVIPKELPSFEEFEDLSKMIQDYDIIPIAGIDSTCQGNLEAHKEQYNAINSCFEHLTKIIGYSHFLVSSPNNIGYLQAHYPSATILVSYSQYITSLNRIKIFFELGANYLTLHPDVLRNLPLLRNLQKLHHNASEGIVRESIVPLNLGCNWGCIYWYLHHNLQSHRTINSPILPNQQTCSDIEDSFDYPLLNCWKARLEDPSNLLKAGWVSPYNIAMYKDLGYNYYLLFTHGFSAEKTIKIINAYLEGFYEDKFNHILNIPHPYGEYWPKDKAEKAIGNLESGVVKNFCEHFPYTTSYPFEKKINAYCNSYKLKLSNGDDELKEEVLSLIDSKLERMEKGAIRR